MPSNSINIGEFPRTRYQGSKRRILSWIYDNIKNLRFHSALDLFGGTGIVSYLLKQMGKKTVYNDVLKFNYWIGVALVENSNVKLSEKDFDFLLTEHDDIEYPYFIQDTFKDIYYLGNENKFLDVTIKNIQMLKGHYDENIAFYKQAMAYYALFQSCIIKRPFNLFHRKNLHIRLNEITRNFGNKTTWDKSFEHYFIKFALEINRSIFDNSQHNKSTNFTALNFPYKNYDLVYLDPPYIPKKDSYKVCNYYKNYHFLEGIIHYDEWDKLIDTTLIHLPLINNGYNWNHKNGNIKGFEKIINYFQDSIIVLSYKEPGLPTVKELKTIIQQFKKVRINIYRIPHCYALNKNNGHYNEVLIIAE